MRRRSQTADVLTEDILSSRHWPNSGPINLFDREAYFVFCSSNVCARNLSIICKEYCAKFLSHLSQLNVNTWYYQEAGQEVDLFKMEVLDRLRQGCIINDSTHVKQSGDQSWKTYSEVNALQNAGSSLPSDGREGTARYYYLDTDQRPVGPLNLGTLRVLQAQKEIDSSTLVSAFGDSEWVRASVHTHLLGHFRSASHPFEPCHPVRRDFESFAKMMGLTLSLYTFYLIPCQSRDIKAITGRERMEFTALLILGIATFGLLSAVMTVLWAYDLERHGKAVGKFGRQESLGTLVLVLMVLDLILAFAIGDFITSFVVSAVLAAADVWLLQKEINLYAAQPEAVR